MLIPEVPKRIQSEAFLLNYDPKLELWIKVMLLVEKLRLRYALVTEAPLRNRRTFIEIHYPFGVILTLAAN